MNIYCLCLLKYPDVFLMFSFFQFTDLKEFKIAKEVKKNSYFSNIVELTRTI